LKKAEHDEENYQPWSQTLFRMAAPKNGHTAPSASPRPPQAVAAFEILSKDYFDP
jgi:hypothetical protein